MMGTENTKIPALTYEDRQAAFRKSAQIRGCRLQLQQKLKNGEVGLKELLEKAPHDQIVSRMKVNTLLAALPNIGKVRSRKLMSRIGISPSRRVQGLGPKQKKLLVEELKGKTNEDEK